MSPAAAFLLGLLGGVHCAGMCGPLILAIHRPQPGIHTIRILARRAIYHAGRLASYALIGLVFGAVGKSLLLAGSQQTVSIALGIALLTGLALSHPNLRPINSPTNRSPSSSSHFPGSVLPSSPVSQTKAAFQSFARVHRLAFETWSSLLRDASLRLIQARSTPAQFGLGMLNGLLPCGLVYVAAAAATATGSLIQGAACMTAFGLGTWPLMLAISMSGAAIPHTFRTRLRSLGPATVSLLACLLILRGLSLDIPLLSPVLDATLPLCH